jgi:hypothetical protein
VSTYERVIEGIVRRGYRQYDQDYGLMLVPKRIHHHTVDVPDGSYHETRDSAYFALALLEWARTIEAEGSDSARRPSFAPGEAPLPTTAAEAREIARGIVTALQASQTVDNRDDRTYGLWHYYAELPVRGWAYKDFNWADFIATALLQIAGRHGDVLGEQSMAELREAVDRAATCVLRRNVSVSYTNISALATFVLAGAGEILGRGDCLSAARERASAMAELVVENGIVDEYFSPTYTGVALMGLVSVRSFVVDEAVRGAARTVELRLWSHLADGWHRASRELAGPHSRAYSVRMGFSWVAVLLYRATAGELDWPEAPVGEFLQVASLIHDVELPHDLQRRFTATTVPRELDEPGEAHPSDAGQRRTRYHAVLTEPWTLGSVDLQDSRTDRQNLLAYWQTSEPNLNGQESGYLILRTRTERDEGAFGLYVTASQSGGDALAAVFPGEFDDPSPMRPRDGADTGFVDTVLQVANPGSPLELLRLSDASRCESLDAEPAATALAATVAFEASWLVVRCGTVDFALRGVGRGGLAAPAVTAGRGGAELEIRWVWYEGERRRVRWAELAGSWFAVLVSLRDPAESFDAWTGRLSASAVDARHDGDGREVTVSAHIGTTSVSVSLPAEALPMETLYARYLNA